MSQILIVAEHANGELNPSTAKCVTCAQGFAAERVDILLLAADVDRIAAQAARLPGITRVLTAQRPENAHPLAAIYAPQIVNAAKTYSHLLLPSTTFGKDLAPRVAALLGVEQISDIMEVESSHKVKRPLYAGNAIATVEADGGQIMVATVRTASFAAAQAGTDSASVEAVESSCVLPDHTRFIGLQSGGGERPDLQSAERVVSGGRALGSAKNFDLIYRLADKLGAGVGASRAAVDAGYVPNDLQVGQTGKIIAPDLYIAVGISGAIQHLTGIKDAGTIVAINKDPDAPIFEVADFGLVADLFQAVPELTAALDG